MKSITKAIALVLALLMVAGLAACGGETNTKAPQNAGPKANTAAENAAQPEPAPRPFAIGTHSESKYRNEYLGMEIALGEPGLSWS